MRFTERLQVSPSNEGLRKWNWWLAAVFAVEAVAILLLGTTKTLPVNVPYLSLDSVQSTSVGSVVLAPASHHLFEVNLAIAAAAVVLISALACVSQATWYGSSYEKGLRTGTNRLRWVQLALCNGLIYSVITLLAGGYDATTLLLVFLLPFITAGLCVMMESQNPVRTRGKAKWGSFVLATFCAFLPWLVIAVLLLGANIFGTGHIPAMTYVLAGAVMVLLGGYGIVPYLSLRGRGPWKQYRYTEISYLVVTVVVQTVFIWLLYAGVLKP